MNSDDVDDYDEEDLEEFDEYSRKFVTADVDEEYDDFLYVRDDPDTVDSVHLRPESTVLLSDQELKTKQQQLLNMQPKKSILKKQLDISLTESSNDEPPKKSRKMSSKNARNPALKHYYAMVDKDQKSHCYFDGRHYLKDSGLKPEQAFEWMKKQVFENDEFNSKYYNAEYEQSYCKKVFDAETNPAIVAKLAKLKSPSSMNKHIDGVSDSQEEEEDLFDSQEENPPEEEENDDEENPPEEDDDERDPPEEDNDEKDPPGDDDDERGPLGDVITFDDEEFEI